MELFLDLDKDISDLFRVIKEYWLDLLIVTILFTITLKIFTQGSAISSYSYTFLYW